MSALRVTEDWRTIREAVAVSLLVHAAVILLIALLARIPVPDIRLAASGYEEPPELTLLELTPLLPPEAEPAAAPPPARFVQLPAGSGPAEQEDLLVRELAAKPRFEAAREMSAGSARLADGDPALPSQDGAEREALQIGPAPQAAPAPAAAEQPPRRPEARAEKPPESETLAPSRMLLDQPAAEPEPGGDIALWDLPAKPARAESRSPDIRLAAREEPGLLQEPVRMETASGARPGAPPARLDGGIEALGAPGVDAAATASGAYKQRIVDLIGERWQAAVNRRIGLLQPGTVRVRFSVDAAGKIQGLRVAANSSNPVAGTITLNAISGVRLPPMPAAVAESLPGGRMEIDFFFSIDE